MYPISLWWSRTMIKLDLIWWMKSESGQIGMKRSGDPEASNFNLLERLLIPPTWDLLMFFTGTYNLLAPTIKIFTGRSDAHSQSYMDDGANRDREKNQPNSCGRDGFEFSLPGSWRNRTEKVIESGCLLCEVSRLSSPFIGFSWPGTGWEMGAPTPLPHSPFLMRGQEERWKRMIKSFSVLFTSLTIWHLLGYLQWVTSVQSCYALKNCWSCNNWNCPCCGAKDDVQTPACSTANRVQFRGLAGKIGGR